MSGPRSLLVVVGTFLLFGCPEPHGLPGDELIGTYAFVATRVDGGCEELRGTEVPEIAFLGTVTRCAPSSPSALCAQTPGRAFLTVGYDDFDAGFDGQYLHVFPRSADRDFEQCGQERTVMTETIDVALLSASQRDALGTPFACPGNPLDGGVPAPNDAGITGPGVSPNGFDAVLACGVMAYTIVNQAFTGDGGPGECRTDAGIGLRGGRCSFTYTLRGDRR